MIKNEEKQLSRPDKKSSAPLQNKLKNKLKF
jgi:hypothetical protein